MDKEQFQKSIDKSYTNSLTRGAANRIIQLLQKLRFSNNENSAKRWIWELCQNAKDACNKSGNVKISVAFDEVYSRLIFKHNGKEFTIDNVTSIINQSSSKDNKNEEDNNSGKFGTGFLTTHLLSEIVHMSGVLVDENKEYSRFQIVLDRSGHDKDELVASLNKSIEQMQNCQTLENGEIIDINAYNTVFEYELDEDGIEVARQGIENLRISAPFVLSMLRDIGEIRLETSREVYKYNKKCECGLENALVHEIIYQSEHEIKSIFVLNLTEDNTTVSIALEITENVVYIKPFECKQSKLFCDFPLIGTEDFPFPVLVSSKYFNPTEPRDGIFLTCNSKTKIDQDIVENRNILIKAYELYEKILNYAAKKDWQGIYNITRINSYSMKEWYDEVWMEEEIVSKCKDIILKAPIILTSNNNMLGLQDSRNHDKVVIISDSDETVREQIWNLVNSISPDKIPCQKDIHNWYYSLWNNCNEYTFVSLTKQLQDYGDIEVLQKSIDVVKWDSWLSNYFNLVSEKKDWQTHIFNNQIMIIPNQSGKFCSISSLYYDKDILSEYKEILKILGNDSREWLLNKNVENREWFGCDKFDDEQILKLIEDRIDIADRQQKTDIYFQIIHMYVNGYRDLSIQKKICEYADNMLGISGVCTEVPAISDKVLEDALKYTMTCIADKISECGEVDKLAESLVKSYEEVLTVLADFIEFAIKHGYEHLINKVTKPILSNQNGKFEIKDNLFVDDDIDDILKELAVFAGYDVREELLAKEIYLVLPESRHKKDIDLSQVITKYVIDNRTSKDEEVRMNFDILLVWMSNNDDKAKYIFPELYKNKHFLYDDNKIAENIKQAQTLNKIMQKFDITSAENLEEIIRRNQILFDKNEENRVEITEDVLIQLGIDSEDALEQAFLNIDFSNQYIRTSNHCSKTYEYVKKILERSKKNIISYLEKREEYDLTEIQSISNTIFVIKKDGKEIYLLARPSDGGEVRIYYDTEKDILDYSMDWELWVEDVISEPQKITFGKMIKLTGLNRIPLRGLRNV